MSWFQLGPQEIAARARAAGSIRVPGLGAFLRRGISGFTIVSLAGFAPWSLAGRWFHQTIGEAGLYLTCAAVFIGLSGPLMHRLILGPDSLVRFYKLFGLAFAAYSVAWIAGWMSLRGQAGSLAGLLAGTALMGWILCTAFDTSRATLKVIGILFVLNALGYFGGGWVEGHIARLNEGIAGFAAEKKTRLILAKMLWGLCYGAGFGAGLGLAFYCCQASARRLVAGETAEVYR
jgi:hypothetical protein